VAGPPPAAILEMAHRMMQAGRPSDAANTISALTSMPGASVEALVLHVQALVAAKRLEEALTASRRAAAAGVPHAELGSAQIAADLGRFAEAAAGFRKVLASNPGDERARRGLARALYAGEAGIEGALAVTDEGLSRGWTPTLAQFKASLLHQAARHDEALEVAVDGLRRLPASPHMHGLAATSAALAGRAEDALAHAEAALRLAPAEAALAVLLAEARLGAGDAAGALHLLDPLRRHAPLDQKLIALHATALRLKGDDGAGRLYDYERFVRAYTLEPPAGWPTLEAFLGDLKARLDAIHDGLGATLDQSVRGGTQTNVNLVGSPEPLIQALFAALEAPVADYVSRLPRSSDPVSDPLAARNRGGFAFGGAWSVRLDPGVGRHVSHIHSEGWLSSAFYVDLPEIMRDGAGEDGWLEFGAPGLPTRPALGPEHKVRPEPGRLVLFPSYVWHGTRPFSGTQTRLGFAFDVIPADPAK
jgi:tetratricopeptide (TPR) repeat protein